MFYDYAKFKLGIPSQNIKELINNQAGESDILLSIKGGFLECLKSMKVTYSYFLQVTA